MLVNSARLPCLVLVLLRWLGLLIAEISIGIMELWVFQKRLTACDWTSQMETCPCVSEGTANINPSLHRQHHDGQLCQPSGTRLSNSLCLAQEISLTESNSSARCSSLGSGKMVGGVASAPRIGNPYLGKVW